MNSLKGFKPKIAPADYPVVITAVYITQGTLAKAGSPLFDVHLIGKNEKKTIKLPNDIYVDEILVAAGDKLHDEQVFANVGILDNRDSPSQSALREPKTQELKPTEIIELPAVITAIYVGSGDTVPAGSVFYDLHQLDKNQKVSVVLKAGSHSDIRIDQVLFNVGDKVTSHDAVLMTYEELNQTTVEPKTAAQKQKETSILQEQNNPDTRKMFFRDMRFAIVFALITFGGGIFTASRVPIPDRLLNAPDDDIAAFEEMLSHYADGYFVWGVVGLIVFSMFMVTILYQGRQNNLERKYVRRAWINSAFIIPLLAIPAFPVPVFQFLYDISGAEGRHAALSEQREARQKEWCDYLIGKNQEGIKLVEDENGIIYTEMDEAYFATQTTYGAVSDRKLFEGIRQCGAEGVGYFKGFTMIDLESNRNAAYFQLRFQNLTEGSILESDDPIQSAKDAVQKRHVQNVDLQKEGMISAVLNDLLEKERQVDMANLMSVLNGEMKYACRGLVYGDIQGQTYYWHYVLDNAVTNNEENCVK